MDSVGLVQGMGSQGSCYGSHYGRLTKLRFPLAGWEKRSADGVAMVMHWSRKSWSRSKTVRAASSPPAVSCERRPSSLYEVLGVPEGGGVTEIKRAYKQMARKYHPDVSPPALAKEHTRVFIRVQEAYEILSDPTKRAVYDRHLATGMQLAFSASKMREQDLGEKDLWNRQWQTQIAELKRRNATKSCQGVKLSWGARVRAKKSEEASTATA